MDIPAMDTYLLHEEPDIAKGRYAVYGDEGQLVAQNDDPRTAISLARACGVSRPTVVNLDMTQGRVYVF